MNTKIIRSVLVIFFLISLSVAQTVRNDLDELNKISVTERLGETIPADIKVTTEKGETVLLNSLLSSEQPTVFMFAYYDCPMLCTMVLNGFSEALNNLDWDKKNNIRIVTLSIDPGEDHLLAAQKKETYINTLKDKSVAENWTFATTNKAAIDTLTAAFGFEYYYVPERDEYAHPAVLFVLSPDNVISRYLYGISYNAFDLKLALLEASQGKIGSTIDRIILYCYHYDADANSYVALAGNIMKLGGLLTLIVLIIFLGTYWIKEKQKRIAF